MSLDQVTAGGDLAPERAIADGPGPDAQSEREAILAAMHEVIRTGLTEKQRSALLAELRGMSQDEIARHLGSNRNAIYKLTHDARRRPKRGCEFVGFTAEDIGTAFAPGEEPEHVALGEKKSPNCCGSSASLEGRRACIASGAQARVAEFAERELAGRSVLSGLEAVAHHLSICSECCAG